MDWHTLITKFLIEMAFDKNKSLTRRLLYIVIYFIFIILLLGIASYVGLNLIKAKALESKVMGYILLIGFVPIGIVMLIYPFMIKKKLGGINREI